jgi:hypothetical protein
MDLLLDGKIPDALFVESPPSNAGGLVGKQRLIKVPLVSAKNARDQARFAAEVITA